jgi:flagellar L-ring protein precursor FlgH
MTRLAYLLVMASLASPSSAAAQRVAAATATGSEAATTTKKSDKKADKAVVAPPADNYDALFAKYLDSARLANAAPAPGSLWMAGLFADLRARGVNDLVTVHVVETISAQGTANSNLDKNSKAALSLANLFGLESKYPSALDPMSLAQLSASTTFKGGGNTARSGSLSADLTARVAEVLPNGLMVIEGVREIEINGDRQIIVLTGVVRQADVGPGNVVASTAIGQMRIRYFGRGLIKDNLQPGVLVRVLNRIF